MVRCPKCSHANPDSARFCMGCGDPMPASAPGPGWQAWLAPRHAAFALLWALGLALPYAVPFQWAFFPPDQWSRQLVYFGLQGACLGAAIGALRGKAFGVEAALWVPAGLAAGAAAWAANWMYLWDHAVYRGVFWLCQVLDPVHSIQQPFRVLQVVRTLALGLALILFHAARTRQWGRLPFHCAMVCLAAWAKYHAAGFPLSGDPVLRLEHLAWVILSAWFLAYGLGRPGPSEGEVSA